MGINEKAWHVGFKWTIGDEDNPTGAIALDDASDALHICEIADVKTDWNVSTTSHPTLYVHSATTPSTDYISMYHDGDYAYLTVDGTTLLTMTTAGVDIAGDLGIVGDVTVTGGVTWTGAVDVTLTAPTTADSAFYGNIVASAGWAAGNMTGIRGLVTLSGTANYVSATGGWFGLDFSTKSGSGSGLTCAINAEITSNNAVAPNAIVYLQSLPNGATADFSNVPFIAFTEYAASGTGSGLLFECGHQAAGSNRNVTTGASGIFNLSTLRNKVNGTVFYLPLSSVTNTFTYAGAVSLNGGAFIFNEDGANLDFRAESSNLAYALYIDGANDCVVIGDNTDISDVDYRLMVGNVAKTLAINESASILYVAPTASTTEFSSGTHGYIATAYFAEPDITGAGGALTVAATVYIANAPDEGTTNAALYIASGSLTTAGTIVVDDVTDASDTTTGSIQTDGGVACVLQLYCGTGITMPSAANYSVLTVGSTANVTGSGVLIDDNDRTIYVCADDNSLGGSAAESLNIARFRMLLIDGPFQGEQYALHGTVKYIGASLSSYGAGVLGTMEWATSISITGYQGGVMARVGGSGTTTVNDYLCGMISTLNLGVAQGGSGKSCAYMVNEVSTYNWDVGLYVDDGAADTGIQMIGCTNAMICGADGDDGGDITLYAPTANYRILWTSDADSNKGTWYFGQNVYGIDVNMYGQTTGESLTWDASAGSLAMATTFAANETAITLTVTDSGTIGGSGRGIGMFIDYAMTGTKTASYGVRSSRINTNIGADVDSVTIGDWYIHTIADRTIGWLTGLDMYWEDHGSGINNLAMISLGKNSNHTVAGRDCYFRCTDHGTPQVSSAVFCLEGENAAANLIEFYAAAGSGNSCLVEDTDDTNVSYSIKVNLRAHGAVTKYIHLHD